MDIKVGDRFLQADGSFAYETCRILHNFVVLECKDLISGSRSRVAWPVTTLETWLSSGNWVYDAVDTASRPSPTTRCPFAKPAVDDYAAVPYSSLIAEEKLQYAVRKELTRNLRAWPICKPSGQAVSIHYFIEFASAPFHAVMLRGAFQCQHCASA